MLMLADKVAIVTGAGSGIGRAAARLFAAEGAAVIVNARRSDPLDALVAEIDAKDGRAVAVAGDVADPETHDRLIAEAAMLGGLDIAFNNAGATGPLKPLAEIGPDEWGEVLAVNLTAAFLGARAQVPAMLRRAKVTGGGGSIIFTGSFVGSSVGLPGMAAYGAAKAGLMGLVRGLAADYGAQGIRANVIQSGGTKTAMMADPAAQEWAATLHAMKRLAEPEEIARAALFLASDMASFVSGSALWADGGNAAVK